jgi:hypothetical protein
MATVLRGRLGFVDSIVLVFWVHRKDVQGPEDAGNWIAEVSGQGRVV